MGLGLADRVVLVTGGGSCIGPATALAFDAEGARVALTYPENEPRAAATAADVETRATWLERLWEAYQNDEIPYLESLGDHWGALCASPEVASHWADALIGTCKMAWSPDPEVRGFFKGATNCLSALLAAESALLTSRG